MFGYGVRLFTTTAHFAIDASLSIIVQKQFTIFLQSEEEGEKTQKQLHRFSRRHSSTKVEREVEMHAQIEHNLARLGWRRKAGHFQLFVAKTLFSVAKRSESEIASTRPRLPAKHAASAAKASCDAHLGRQGCDEGRAPEREREVNCLLNSLLAHVRSETVEGVEANYQMPSDTEALFDSLIELISNVIRARLAYLTLEEAGCENTCVIFIRKRNRADSN